MGMVIDVPLNTTIADLDDALRVLMKRELKRHGFDAVDVAFDAPAKDWSGKLTNPTVNMFLYDVRQAPEKEMSGGEVRGANGVVATVPPLRLELTYAVTAWTKAVEDEHRLLSQVLAILFTYRDLPADVTEGRLEAAASLRGVETQVGSPREEKSDFWSSVGGQYKASIDYVVRLSVASGVTFVRGPEVRVQTMRTAIKDGPRRTMLELHRIGGKVHDDDGDAVENAWVVAPELGLWASTDAEGKFLLTRVPDGKLSLVARTMDGGEARTSIDVPGGAADMVIGSTGAKKKARK